MTYASFRDLIRAELKVNREGLTWQKLRSKLKLPYDQPCPEWMRRMEREIALVREKGEGRALVWRLNHRRS